MVAKLYPLNADRLVFPQTSSIHNHATERILIADPPHILDQKERSGHVPEKFPLAVNKC
jgi:hypothetical protein